MISRAARRTTIKRIFPLASWFWDKIPSSPLLHPLSTSWATTVANGGTGHVADIHEFGCTVVRPNQIDTTTSAYDIAFSNDWGPDPFGSDLVHIPAATPIPVGGDGHVVIVDPINGKAYGLWQATNPSGWGASWGGVAALSGDGIDSAGSKSTASRLSRYAGIVLIDELVAAAKANTGLRHALFFSSAYTAPSFVYPAADTDGVSGSIPEGARLQLDPSIDVDSISGITAAEKVIAKTLQTHGGYIADSGEAPLALICEDIPGDPGDAYTALGFEWDYFDMTHIPWSNIRFLQNWDGAAGAGPAFEMQYIDSGAAAATSLSVMPTHQAQDLLVAYAYRDGNNTAPTVPAGWTVPTGGSGGANTNSAVIASKRATSSSEVSGTWANATGLVIEVWRGAGGIGAVALGGGSGNTITYPAAALTDKIGSSIVSRFAGHRTATNLLTNTPAGYLARAGVATEARSLDTAVGVTGDPASATQSVNQSSGWRAATIELITGVAASSAGSGSLNFTRLIPADAKAVLVGVAVGLNNINSFTAWTRTVTCGGVAMTSLGVINTGGNPGPSGYYGFVELFGLLNPTPGVSAVAISLSDGSHTPTSIVAWSDTFDDVSSFGSPTTGVGSTGAASLSVTAAAGNKIVAIAAGGQTFSGMTQTQRAVNNVNTSSGAGNIAVTQAVSAGSALTLASTNAINDYWGIVAVPLVA